MLCVIKPWSYLDAITFVALVLLGLGAPLNASCIDS